MNTREIEAMLQTNSNDSETYQGEPGYLYLLNDFKKIVANPKPRDLITDSSSEFTLNKKNKKRVRAPDSALSFAKRLKSENEFLDFTIQIVLNDEIKGKIKIYVQMDYVPSLVRSLRNALINCIITFQKNEHLILITPFNEVDMDALDYQLKTIIAENPSKRVYLHENKPLTLEQATPGFRPIPELKKLVITVKIKDNNSKLIFTHEHVGKSIYDFGLSLKKFFYDSLQDYKFEPFKEGDLSINIEKIEDMRVSHSLVQVMEIYTNHFQKKREEKITSTTWDLAGATKTMTL